MKALMVAGTHSGCGKTSVSLGLMAALTRRGLKVAPFKSGPDFIDPGLHRLAVGRPSCNLDGWMLGRDMVRRLFALHAAGADVAVVEGAMGLFDSFSPSDESGSAAHLAKELGLPVLLTASGASMSRSAAALVQGYARFDPDLDLAGAVFNQVAGASHAGLIREAVALYTDVPVFGCLPRDQDAVLPSRHLGLVTAEDSGGAARVIDRLADMVEEHVDLDALLKSLPPLALPRVEPEAEPEQVVRMAVARDRAFCFYYEDNLRLLRLAGAEPVFFSPLRDKSLPKGVSGLYLGGGYPELSGYELGNNKAMRRAVKAASEAGMPIFAECGGFMYLTEAIVDARGSLFPMCGVFPFASRMRSRRTALGYREVRTTGDCPLGPPGSVVRGHEFHYSSLEGGMDGVPAVFAPSGRRGPLPGPEGFLSGNTLGTYIHLHFASNLDIPAHFVELCRTFDRTL